MEIFCQIILVLNVEKEATAKKNGEEAQHEENVGKSQPKVPYILQLITGKMEDVNYCSILIRAHDSKKTTTTTMTTKRREGEKSAMKSN